MSAHSAGPAVQDRAKRPKLIENAVGMEEPRPGGDRLDSWKAIAHYLQRDVATVRRWEKTSGLPVRRVPGGSSRAVFAYVSELEAWLNTGGSAQGPKAAALP